MDAFLHCYSDEASLSHVVLTNPSFLLSLLFVITANSFCVADDSPEGVREQTLNLLKLHLKEKGFNATAALKGIRRTFLTDQESRWRTLELLFLLSLLSSDLSSSLYRLQAKAIPPVDPLFSAPPLLLFDRCDPALVAKLFEVAAPNLALLHTYEDLPLQPCASRDAVPFLALLKRRMASQEGLEGSGLLICEGAKEEDEEEGEEAAEEDEGMGKGELRAEVERLEGEVFTMGSENEAYRRGMSALEEKLAKLTEEQDDLRMQVRAREGECERAAEERTQLQMRVAILQARERDAELKAEENEALGATVEQLTQELQRSKEFIEKTLQRYADEEEERKAQETAEAHLKRAEEERQKQQRRKGKKTVSVQTAALATPETVEKKRRKERKDEKAERENGGRDKTRKRGE